MTDDLEISMLLIRRNSLQFEIEQIDELLNKIGETKGLADATKKAPTKTQTATVQEATFNILKFEPQQGAKLGNYEVAYKANNPADKWTSAFNILKNSNATIQERYHGQGYSFSYWLYGNDKIYRQKFREKTTA